MTDLPPNGVFLISRATCRAVSSPVRASAPSITIKRSALSSLQAPALIRASTAPLKYALMFLGLVFLTFFLFEATMGARAHPAQYILLGLTQVIFYLLVLALSEHIGFGAAFAITAAATVTLSGYYAATVFHSVVRGLIAFAAFSGAYGLIYLLMKSEDYALLIGSVTAFGAIALTMYITRNLDWYDARTQSQPEKSLN